MPNDRPAKAKRKLSKKPVRRAFSGRPLNVDEPELVNWATQRSITSTMDKLSGYGAIAFWCLIACILLARVAIFDPSQLRPIDQISDGKRPVINTTR